MSWYNLPEVALIRVLNYLPVLDQIKSARLVCRYWKQIMDSSVRQDELILFLEIYPRPVYWYHDGTEPHLDNAILVNQLGFLENEFSLKYFRRLRRLMVVSRMGVSCKRLFEQVEASCKQLEHLQFSYLGCKFSFMNFKPLIYKTNLQLANLRTFYSQGGNIPLGLHFPQLSELYVYSHLNIKETDEKTRSYIKNLRTLLVRRLTYPPGFEFSNLEVFYFNLPNPSISLIDFPCLKEIHFFELVWGIRPEINDVLENLLEQKRRLKRDQLKIYFDGFELKNRTDFELLETYEEPTSWFECKLSLNESILRLIKETPSRLKFNLLFKGLMISDDQDDELIGLQEGDELVRSMFRSAQCINFESDLFTSLNSFRSKKKSLNLFKMSNRFRYVCSASVQIEPSQSILDQLPDVFPHLVEFFYDCPLVYVCIPNFQFIGRFKSLHQFYVHPQFLSIDELRFIFENCKFINRVEFQKSNAEIRLSRAFGRKVYQAEWHSTNGIRFASATFSVDELLDYFEASKWAKKNDLVGLR